LGVGQAIGIIVRIGIGAAIATIRAPTITTIRTAAICAAVCAATVGAAIGFGSFFGFIDTANGQGEGKEKAKCAHWSS
jgi:hypothetical protein